MRLLSLLLTLLAFLSLQPSPALAAGDGLGIAFTGNSWGYLKPCPS